MDWYKREIRKYKIDTTWMMLWTWLGSIIVLIWVYFTSDNYSWQNIEVIPLVPWIPIVLSALTFATLWRLLYKTKIVYPPLYFICVVLLRDKRLYRDAKEYIWAGLMAFMWIIVLPTVVSFINFIISIFVNAFYFIIYLSPALALSWVGFWVIIYFLSKKDVTNKRWFRKI